LQPVPDPILVERDITYRGAKDCWPEVVNQIQVRFPINADIEQSFGGCRNVRWIQEQDFRLESLSDCHISPPCNSVQELPDKRARGHQHADPGQQN
jgi:hypothetical protein